jgi:hypothetical protein
MAQFYTPPLISASQKNQINQITKIQLTNGETVAFTDWTDRMLYSTADLLSGFTDQKVSLFSYSDGEDVSHTKNITTARTATQEDTNISNAAEMDATQEFLCYSIQIEVYQTEGTADGITSYIGRPGAPMPNAGIMSLLHARIIFALRVSQKDFPVASLGWFVAGFGPVIGHTYTDQSLAVNGQPGHHARFDQSVPIHIGGTEKYHGELRNLGTEPSGVIDFPDDDGVADATAYVLVRANMRGLHKRPMG